MTTPTDRQNIPTCARPGCPRRAPVNRGFEFCSPTCRAIHTELSSLTKLLADSTPEIREARAGELAALKVTDEALTVVMVRRSDFLRSSAKRRAAAQ